MRRLALIGAFAMLGQVVLLRELAVVYFGDELIYVFGLGLWLVGTGAGALMRRAPRPDPATLGRICLLGGVLLPALVVFARGARRLAGVVPGAEPDLLLQIAIATATLLPAALLSGRLFRDAADLALARGRSPAAAYASDGAGALAGGAASVALLVAGVGGVASAAIGGLAAVAAAAPAWRAPRFPRAIGIAVTAALVAGLVASPTLERRLTAWNHPGLLAARDTPYGRVVAAGRGGQIALFVNDALVHESQGVDAETFVQIAALQRDAPRRILILGGAWEDLPREAARLRPDALVDVEPDAAVVAMLRELRGADAFGPAEVAIADPRRYLASVRDRDLILAAMPEPATGADNRYYTREFFAACDRALAPDGVLAFRLRGAENLWTPALARKMASVHRALASVFPAVVVLPGTTNLFLASRAPLPTTADQPARRLAERGLATRLVGPAYLRYLYGNDRFTEIPAQLAATVTPANTDLAPVCYRHTLVLGLARLFPSLGWREISAPGPADLARRPAAWLALAAVAAAAALAARRRPGLRSALAMGATAAAGTVLETALLLAYQVRGGVLYRDLGLLTGLFMLGLAAGAAGVALAGRRGRAAPGGRPGLLPAAALALLSAATAGALSRGAAGSLAAVGAATAAAGAAVAAVFGRLGGPANPQGDVRPARIGPLYASDLAGGGLGALAAGLFLIPFWGLAGTAAAAALLAALAVAPLAARDI